MLPELGVNGRVRFVVVPYSQGVGEQGKILLFQVLFPPTAYRYRAARSPSRETLDGPLCTARFNRGVSEL